MAAWPPFAPLRVTNRYFPASRWYLRSAATRRSCGNAYDRMARILERFNGGVLTLVWRCGKPHIDEEAVTPVDGRSSHPLTVNWDDTFPSFTG